jgi:hypothetical protein
MPTWAAERASELGAEAATSIAKLGINVVGDLDSLGRMPGHTDDDASPPAVLPSSMAAEAIVAAVLGAHAAGRREGEAGGVDAMQTSDGRATIELSPGMTKALKRTRDSAKTLRYRVERLRHSAR